MERSDYGFNLLEAPRIADRILRNYKRDRSYFEHYSPKFDNDFLTSFEEKVDTLTHLTPLQTLENEIAKKDEKIQILISHFRPLLNVTEDLLRRGAEELNLPVANFNLNELRESLKHKCVWEIQKNCRKMVHELEPHIEELLDKGFILRILNDFQVLMAKLKNAEWELAVARHQHDMMADEYLLIDNQLKGFVETIIQSTPEVFGESNADKMEEYSLERLMVQDQFMRGERQ